MLAQIVRDPHLRLLYWLPGSQIHVDANGRECESAAVDGPVCTQIIRAGVPLGAVLHGSADARTTTRLSKAAEAAAMAIEIVALRVELRRQLAQVEAARAGVAAAAGAERHRIERDLHDGAQQRLISVGLTLRHAQHCFGSTSREASELLNDAVAQLAVALHELRELTHGVRPAHLDAGLGPALKELGARCPLPIETSAERERLPADVEAAAYFIASEGVTNAVKHARASRVLVNAAHTNGTLTLSVRDDGVGGASPSRGSGLRGLLDRIEGHGGTMHLESPRSRGTLLVAELPCN